MKEDLSISLGDFGVATIMGDARTRTRTTVGKNIHLYVHIYGVYCVFSLRALPY